MTDWYWSETLEGHRFVLATLDVSACGGAIEPLVRLAQCQAAVQTFRLVLLAERRT